MEKYLDGVSFHDVKELSKNEDDMEMNQQRDNKIFMKNAYPEKGSKTVNINL